MHLTNWCRGGWCRWSLWVRWPRAVLWLHLQSASVSCNINTSPCIPHCGLRCSPELHRASHKLFASVSLYLPAVSRCTAAAWLQPQLCWSHHIRTCTNVIFWWILARDPIINYSWCIIQSRGWECVDARPLCLTKHRVLVYCWRTNSLEQSFSSPSRGELWLELFSRHSLILQFRLNTTKSFQIKYSLARSFWYCFCERPWNVKHFNI